ncbi:hypothetical protein KKA50_02810 [Patescibacteria group bacterium]|nr:hypothetical protein [Patescibacteria group bacterium]
MKIKIKSKYEGMGFVEALIAIMVVGASSVVLMQIAARTLQEMIQNETIDTMTQYAVEGATMVQNVAMQEKLSGEDVFPDQIGSNNNCYVIDKDGDNQYTFRKTEQGYVTYNLEDRESYRANALVPEDDEGQFFRIFCIEDYSLTEKYVVVEVIVGQTTVNPVEVNGENITKGYSVKDYTYFTVVNL